MQIDSLRSRINKLATKFVQEIEDWPPIDGIAKAIFDAHVRDGVEMLPPTQRPDEPVLFYLIKVGAEKAFENFEDDPLDETRLKK